MAAAWRWMRRRTPDGEATQPRTSRSRPGEGWRCDVTGAAASHDGTVSRSQAHLFVQPLVARFARVAGKVKREL